MAAARLARAWSAGRASAPRRMLPAVRRVVLRRNAFILVSVLAGRVMLLRNVTPIFHHLLCVSTIGAWLVCVAAGVEVGHDPLSKGIRASPSRVIAQPPQPSSTVEPPSRYARLPWL